MPLLFLLLGVGVVAIAAASRKNVPGKKPGYVTIPPLPGKVPAPAKITLQPAPRGTPYVADGFAAKGRDHENDAAIPTGSPLPATSPDGYPWLLWHGSHSAPFSNGSDGNLGLDTNGTFWSYTVLGRPFIPKPGWTADPDPVRTGWVIRSFSGSTSWIDSFGDAIRVALPYLAAAASLAIPGVGGIVASGILIAASRLASGASITQTLVDGTRDALPALRENSAFDTAYKQADGLYQSGKTLPEVQAIAAKAKAALLTPEERTAYDQGQAMALGRRNQEAALAWLKGQIPAKVGLIDLAMAHGAALGDVLGQLGGPPAIKVAQAAGWID